MPRLTGFTVAVHLKLNVDTDVSLFSGVLSINYPLITVRLVAELRIY